MTIVDKRFLDRVFAIFLQAPVGRLNERHDANVEENDDVLDP